MIAQQTRPQKKTRRRSPRARTDSGASDLQNSLCTYVEYMSAFLNLLLLRIIHAAYLTVTSICAALSSIGQRSVTCPPYHVASHVGIIVCGGTEADIKKLAALIGWLASAGVRFITVCDALSGSDGGSSSSLIDGSDACLNRLRDELCAVSLASASVVGSGVVPAASISRSSAGSASKGRASMQLPAIESAGEASVAVRVLSLSSGRDDLVQAARRLCERVQAGELPAAKIDEATVEAELTANAGFPEPELILQCCPELHLGGLLPWHCRVTQFAHLGPLREVGAERVHRALVEYAGVQQRYGR